MYLKVKCIDIISETSATGGNDGAIMGGDVYSMGIDMSSRSGPTSTGDLVESPVDTGIPNQNRKYGIPVKKKKKLKKFSKLKEHAVGSPGHVAGNFGDNYYGMFAYQAGTIYGNPSPNPTGDMDFYSVGTVKQKEPNKLEPKEKNKKSAKHTIVKSEKDGKKMKILDYQGYIKSKMNVVTHLKK